jgi:hypothetical protein
MNRKDFIKSTGIITLGLGLRHSLDHENLTEQLF